MELGIIKSICYVSLTIVHTYIRYSPTRKNIFLTKGKPHCCSFIRHQMLTQVTIAFVKSKNSFNYIFLAKDNNWHPRWHLKTIYILGSTAKLLFLFIGYRNWMIKILNLQISADIVVGETNERSSSTIRKVIVLFLSHLIS